MVFEITSLSTIQEIAQKFIEQVIQKNNSHCYAFYGEMGIGKTTFIIALCNALSVIDTVNSPTFTIINEYLCSDDASIFHFDFYRLKTVEEFMDLGYEDYFYAESLCFIEWPEKIEELLPDDTIKINMQLLSNGKRYLEII